VQEFLDMGGYAAFVWPAYGITALIMVILFVVSWRAAKTSDAKLKALQSTVRRGRRAVGPEPSDGDAKEAVSEA
jgi:heme exporter protein D